MAAPLSAPRPCIRRRLASQCDPHPLSSSRQRRSSAAVRREHSVIAHHVHPRRRHSRREPRQQIQRLEHDMGGAFAIRGLRCIAHPTGCAQRQALRPAPSPCAGPVCNVNPLCQARGPTAIRSVMEWPIRSFSETPCAASALSHALSASRSISPRRSRSWPMRSAMCWTSACSSTVMRSGRNAAGGHRRWPLLPLNRRRRLP